MKHLVLFSVTLFIQQLVTAEVYVRSFVHLTEDVTYVHHISLDILCSYRLHSDFRMCKM